MKAKGQKIVMITAYDATFAKLAESSGVDIVLVGDSLGMVMQGHEDTLEVTLDEVVYHCRCVRRGLQNTHLVADLPFMSYQVSPRQALKSAGVLVQKGKAHAVKLEGGKSVVSSVKKIVQSGIPVMGHIGLTPQSIHAFGGFRVQGRNDRDAKRLFEDAQRLQDAGAYSLVLEGIPAQLATEISAALEIPTIGIGAGVGCDGQVLVMQDLLGLDEGFQPKFVKRFAQIGRDVRDAFSLYASEVRSGEFPAAEHSFGDAPATTESMPSKGYGPQ